MGADLRSSLVVVGTRVVPRPSLNKQTLLIAFGQIVPCGGWPGGRGCCRSKDAVLRVNPLNARGDSAYCISNGGEYRQSSCHQIIRHVMRP